MGIEKPHSATSDYKFCINNLLNAFKFLYVCLIVTTRTLCNHISFSPRDCRNSSDD